MKTFGIAAAALLLASTTPGFARWEVSGVPGGGSYIPMPSSGVMRGGQPMPNSAADMSNKFNFPTPTQRDLQAIRDACARLGGQKPIDC
jgi:hypothetical protein